MPMNVGFCSDRTGSLFMETTYAIEFMRLAEPPLALIKQPSAFHVAFLCARLRNSKPSVSKSAQKPPQSKVASLIASSGHPARRAGRGGK
jgi:hypothetical protein